MSGAMLALRKAILTDLQAVSDLALLMGGTVQLHDEAPRAASDVYATFGDARAEDWSTGSNIGHAHTLNITVWAKPGTAVSALSVAEAMAARLDGATLTLDGHRMVLMSILSVVLERDARTQLGRATVRIKALTEQI